MEVARDVGTAICKETGKKVSLKDPDLTIYLELLSKEVYYAIEKIQGPGGMPVGVSGKVACLISGGIDSPVAAYRMMKRGCRALFVHFSGRPLVSRASEEKVRELVQTPHGPSIPSKLYVIPFGEIQRDIVANAPAPFRVVLYRRVMIRIAQELAKREHCWGLVTGDSLGQVASQTPENLTVIEEAAELPTPASAHRHGQGGNHRPGSTDRHLRHFNRAGSRLLLTLHPAAPQHENQTR